MLARGTRAYPAMYGRAGQGPRRRVATVAAARGFAGEVAEGGGGGGATGSGDVGGEW